MAEHVLRCAAIVLAGFIGALTGRAEEAELPSLDEIISRVQEAAVARDRLLERARGTCIVRSRRGEPWGETEAYTHLKPDETGAVWPSDRFESVFWAQRGTLHRFDYCCEFSLREEWRGWPSRSRRIAFDQARERVYEPDIETGFVECPRRYGNFIPLPWHFDIDTFYGGATLAPERVLPWLRTEGYDVNIAWSQIEGVPCLHLSFARTWPAEGRHWYESARLYGFHLAPDMNHSLIKGVFVEKHTFRSVVRGYVVVEWLGDYEESAPGSGTWLLEHLTASEKRDRGGEPGPAFERMEVRFTETQLDATIEDEMFTFRGLGLPEERPIYDTRIPASPVPVVETGGQIHPAPYLLPWSLPSAMKAGEWEATALLREFESDIAGFSRPQLLAFALNRAEIPTVHRNLWRSIVLRRLRQSSEEQDFVENLLEYAIAMQDDVIVRALIRPHFSSRGETVHGNTWGAIAQDLVKETLDHHAERLTPLHVEALHRSITVMEPYQVRIPGEQPAGFESALRLLLRCLEHPDRRIQQAALEYLPTRNLSGPELAREIADALERALQNPDFSAAPEGVQSTIRGKLETIRAGIRAERSP